MKKPCDLCGALTKDRTRVVVIRFIKRKGASAGVWGNYKTDTGHTRVCDGCGETLENVARQAITRHITAIRRLSAKVIKEN